MRNNDMQTDGGFDSGSGDAGAEQPRKLGLGDTKKVLILGGLVVVGGAIVAYQFLGGGGPTSATAVTPPPPGTAVAAVPAGNPPVSAVATNTGTTGAGDELSVAGIERLVKEFDGYVKARQVPLGHLKTSPFRTKQARAVPRIDPDGTAATAAPETVPVKPRPSMPQLALGSIMVAGDKRWAVINNRLCSVGSMVAGCKVETIETDRVRVSRDGETMDLQMKPPATDKD